MVLQLLAVALRSFALETAPHLFGEASVHRAVVSADQAFHRAIKEFEFAIEQQKLKRADLRDLVDLIGGSMDLSHLVGALLLEFCIAFYCESKLLEEGESHVPGWIPKLFLLSNIGALGYLLFAVWLALHASVAGHAIGVELLLNHSRLTIPTPDVLDQVQRSTTMLAQFRWRRAAASPAAAARAQLPPQPSPRKGVEAEGASGVAEPLAAAGAASRWQQLESRDHRERFADHRSQWLGFDAYSRVCMALGMNQMLQSLSYFVIGPIAQHSPTIALISLFGIQMLALLLMRLDVCDDGADATEQCSLTCKAVGTGCGCLLCPQPQKPNGVARHRRGSGMQSCSGAELCFALATFCLPPVSAGALLWVHPTVSSMSYERFVSLLVTPCFFLHASWLVFIIRHVAPSPANGLPQRLRTVRYLKLFVQDARGGGLGCSGNGAAEQPEGLRLQTGRADRWCEGPFRNGESSQVLLGDPGLQTLALPPAPRGARRTEAASLRASAVLSGGRGDGEPVRPERPDLGWVVVRVYTCTVVVLWALGACVHLAECFAGDSGAAPAGPPALLDLRPVEVAWPEPPRLFEVASLQCGAGAGGAVAAVGGRFAVYVAGGAEGAEDGAERPLALAAAGDFPRAAVACRGRSGCAALFRPGAQSPWELAPLGAPWGAGPAVQVQVPLPHDWDLAAAAWTHCGSEPCDAMTVAGWDGSEVVIANMSRSGPGDAWRLRRRFTVRPLADDRPRSQGHGDAVAATSARHSSVRALHLGPGADVLLVLLAGGELHAWDLRRGLRAGAWKVAGSYSAVCHDGKDVLLARPGARGPVLERAALPLLALASEED